MDTKTVIKDHLYDHEQAPRLIRSRLRILHRKPQASPSSYDRSYRSVIKAMTWRLIGTLDTVLISFLITGRVTAALSIGATELCTKMLLFYTHERIWNRIRLGRVDNCPPLPEPLPLPPRAADGPLVQRPTGA